MNDLEGNSLWVQCLLLHRKVHLLEYHGKLMQKCLTDRSQKLPVFLFVPEGKGVY